MFSSINRSYIWLQTLLGLFVCYLFLTLFTNPITHVVDFSHESVAVSAPVLVPVSILLAVHAPVPAPVIQTTPLVKVDDSVWTNIRQDFKMDHKAQLSQVKSEIRKLLADQNKLYSILKAASPYIYFIHQQTQQRGLPGELALIPVIESEFNPNDHSTKGATGLWQLMPGTAHELGVKVRSRYDGRRNVVVSTAAALAYFKDLGVAFDGDWYLAIAAYNCGQVKIDSAIRRAGSHSFWNLSIPKETKVYLPKLMAVAEIIKNPKKYGVTLPPIANQPYFTQLKVDKPLTLNHVAKTSGISIETLKVLNPDYTHEVMPTKKGQYILLVPAGAPTTRARETLASSSVII
ncbi:MAG: transglycosylase SLT domain-containing protein [Pseudomonadota bacterium]